jgi:hypothetical protein
MMFGCVLVCRSLSLQEREKECEVKRKGGEAFFAILSANAVWHFI